MSPIDEPQPTEAPQDPWDGGRGRDVAVPAARAGQGGTADAAPRPAARLSDVAKLAKCSAATVSRVLNAPQTVNAEARLKVEVAVRDLGYMRNGAARALRSRRSQIVGLILPTLKQPVYAGFVETLQGTLARHGHSLLVTTSDYSLDQELCQARVLAERGIDGLVLVGQGRRPELYAMLEAQDVPYVTTYTLMPRSRHPVVGFDNRDAIGKVAQFLVGLGHRDFAMVVSDHRENDRVDERIAGVASALAAHGLTLPPERIVRVGFTTAGGRAALARLVAAGARPTAVICSCDILAYGVLIEAKTRGLRVPSDLSVTGFDDLADSSHLHPALTSLAISADEIGRLAGQYLLARIAGRPHDAQVAIETRLMVRGTTASPPG